MDERNPVLDFLLELYASSSQAPAKEKILKVFASSSSDLLKGNFGTLLHYFESLIRRGLYEYAERVTECFRELSTDVFAQNSEVVIDFIMTLHNLTRQVIQEPQRQRQIVPILHELLSLIPNKQNAYNSRREMHVLWIELIIMHSFSPLEFSDESREALSKLTCKTRNLYPDGTSRICPYMEHLAELAALINLSDTQIRKRAQKLLKELVPEVSKTCLRSMNTTQLLYSLAVTWYELLALHETARIMSFRYFERCVSPQLQEYFSCLIRLVFSLFIKQFSTDHKPDPERIERITRKLIHRLASPYQGLRLAAATFISDITNECPGILWSWPCCNRLFKLFANVNEMSNLKNAFLIVENKTSLDKEVSMSLFLPKTLRETIRQELHVIIKAWIAKAFTIAPLDISSMIEQSLLNKPLIWTQLEKSELELMSFIPESSFPSFLANIVVKSQLIGAKDENGEVQVLCRETNELAARVIRSPELDEEALNRCVSLPFETMNRAVIRSATWSWEWCCTSKPLLMGRILDRILLEIRKLSENLKENDIPLNQLIQFLQTLMKFLNCRYQTNIMSIAQLDTCFEYLAETILHLLTSYEPTCEWIPTHIYALEWILMLITQKNPSIPSRSTFYATVLNLMALSGPITVIAAKNTDLHPHFSHLLELLSNDEKRIKDSPYKDADISDINILSQWAYAKTFCLYREHGLPVDQALKNTTPWPKFDEPKVSAMKRLWKHHTNELLRYGWHSGDPEVRALTASLILEQPEVTMNSYEAVFLLITKNPNFTTDYNFDCKKWSVKLPPELALSLIAPPVPKDPNVIEYGLISLGAAPPEFLIKYVPQIIQALRFDKTEQISQFIADTAYTYGDFSQLVQWGLLTEIQASKKGSFREKLENLSLILTRELTTEQKTRFTTAAILIKSILDVSSALVSTPKRYRKARAVELLREIEIPAGSSLPIKPEKVITAIKVDACKPLPSHAKVPLLVSFSTSDGGSFGCIFKTNDDVRQDILALQLIDKFLSIWREAKLDVWMKYYKIVAVGPDEGIIELITNAKSRDEVGKETESQLFEYFQAKYGPPGSVTYHAAQYNFIASLAPYSIVSYLLSFKDRHNGNIMIDADGHIIHIDFGFILDIAPGGNIRFEKAPFKLTREMILVMGGYREAEPFQAYKKLCAQCFLAARERSHEIVSLVALMIESGLPAITKNTIKNLLKRFKLELSPEKATQYCSDLIEEAYKAVSTDIYDGFQAWQNGITF